MILPSKYQDKINKIFIKWLYEFDEIDELLWYVQLFIAVILATTYKRQCDTNYIEVPPASVLKVNGSCRYILRKNVSYMLQNLIFANDFPIIYSLANKIPVGVLPSELVQSKQ